MKRTIIAFVAGLTISGLVAFTAVNYESKENTAEVDQIQGFYIFPNQNLFKNMNI